MLTGSVPERDNWWTPPLLEAGIVHTYWQSAIYLATGVSPAAMGSAHPLMAPYQSFETRDGWINIGAANQANWERLLEVLGAPELGRDPRFADNAGRMSHLAELVEQLTPCFRSRTTASWLEKFQAAGIPAGPVLSIAAMHADPQVKARRMVTEVPHSRLGQVEDVGGAGQVFGDAGLADPRSAAAGRAHSGSAA